MSDQRFVLGGPVLVTLMNGDQRRGVLLDKGHEGILFVSAETLEQWCAENGWRTHHCLEFFPWSAVRCLRKLEDADESACP